MGLTNGRMHRCTLLVSPLCPQGRAGGRFRKTSNREKVHADLLDHVRAVEQTGSRTPASPSLPAPCPRAWRQGALHRCPCPPRTACRRLSMIPASPSVSVAGTSGAELTPASMQGAPVWRWKSPLSSPSSCFRKTTTPRQRWSMWSARSPVTPISLRISGYHLDALTGVLDSTPPAGIPPAVAAPEPLRCERACTFPRTAASRPASPQALCSGTAAPVRHALPVPCRIAPGPRHAVCP